MNLRSCHKQLQIGIVALFTLLTVSLSLKGQEVISVHQGDNLKSIGMGTSVKYDPHRFYDEKTIWDATGFQPIHKDIPNFPESKINNWLRFSCTNQTGQATLHLLIQTPNLPEVTVFKQTGDRLNLIYRAGDRYPYLQRQEDDVNFICDLHIPSGDTATYFIRVVSDHHLQLPMVIGTRSLVTGAGATNVFIIGAYFGILLVIFFYNLFIYFSVNDKNYLYYIIYVFFLGLAQMSSSGFGFKYFWPDQPGLNQYMVILTSSLVCMVAIMFAIPFLQQRKYAPKLMGINLYFLISYTMAIICDFAGVGFVSYIILNVNGFLMAFFVISTSAYISRKGFKPALFYLVAWSIYMLALIVYVLKNFGIISSNNFSNYALYWGSSIEAVLLSIALADKINTLTREKQVSQEQALEISLENERLVREQNLLLEAKVHERTIELEDSNRSLHDTLENLKATQSQLVEAEKMASLGVLTAGIAHEINNPINFVKSNIKPLQLDIQDLWEIIDQYEKLDFSVPVSDQLALINAFKKKIDLSYIKEEIGSLLQGIEDGAIRTAEIVRGLRTFSRVDETELKKVNLYEGLDSTLVLLRSSMPNNVQVVRNFQTIPPVECFPGKLNQVFMNIMSNALYAMAKKPSGETEYLTVSTRLYDGDHVEIKIADTGTGMPDSVKEKIFDPFFTTKEIGEGTGLGLSIVFSIIEKHKGRILVHSTIGVGTEFQIILPIVHPSN